MTDTLEEFPPYITVTRLNNAWHVNLMRYDKGQEQYQVSATRKKSKKSEAFVEALDWAKSEGCETRGLYI